jgi:hypothetical protein
MCIIYSFNITVPTDDNYGRTIQGKNFLKFIFYLI